MKLSIIIPAYNEEKRIGKTLEAYSVFFEKIRKAEKIEYEIFIVINNTKDKTEQVVQSFRKKNKKIIYINLEKGGKGYAITEGFKNALKRKNDFIGFVDADLATFPDQFFLLLKNIEGYDATIASRALPESKVYTSLKRRITSRGFNFVVRSLLFLPYKDTQCGAKLFRREPAKLIAENKSLAQWAFDVQILYMLQKNGYKIKEVPTIWYDKAGSKMNLIKTPIQMFASVVRFRLINSPFRFVVRLYDRLPESIKIHHF
ncbi:MAG: glycosyltransferase [Nanoarchaeota archaeon]